MQRFKDKTVIVTGAGSGIGVLVNNAGIVVDGEINQVSPKDWQKQFQTNVFGPYSVIRISGRPGAMPSIRPRSRALGVTGDGGLRRLERGGYRLHPCAVYAVNPAVTAFLALDDARCVTGVNFPIDGGCMASNGQTPR